MLLKNPYRHYPTFVARVIYTDGAVIVRRGMAEDATLYFPGEEEDVRAIALVVKDEGNRPVGEKMWVDGCWLAYDEELLDRIENGEEEEEEEVEEEEAVEEVVEVEEDLEMDSDVSFAVVREDTKDELDEDE